MFEHYKKMCECLKNFPPSLAFPQNIFTWIPFECFMIYMWMIWQQCTHVIDHKFRWKRSCVILQIFALTTKMCKCTNITFKCLKDNVWMWLIICPYVYPRFFAGNVQPIFNTCLNVVSLTFNCIEITFKHTTQNVQTFCMSMFLCMPYDFCKKGPTNF